MMSKSHKAILRKARKKLEERVGSLSCKISEFRKGFRTYKKAAKRLGKANAIYLKAEERYRDIPDRLSLKEKRDVAYNEFLTRRTVFLGLKEHNDALLKDIYDTYELLRTVSATNDRNLTVVIRTEEDFRKEAGAYLAKIDKYVNDVSWEE